MNLMHLGAMLRECRGDRSIKSAAKQLKISARTYRLIELGRQRPQIRTCYILANFLGKPSDEILALAGYTVPGERVTDTTHVQQTNTCSANTKKHDPHRCSKDIFP